MYSMLYTEEDLELAYSEGYNQAYDELESMLESNEYSLEDECNYYTESNEDNYTALEQAYLEMLTKDDKKAMRNLNEFGKTQGRNKIQRFNDLKDYAALTSKKKDGNYTVDSKDVDKRLASRSDHDRSVRNDMERTAVIKSAYGNRKMRQMTNNAYKHVGARLGIK